MTEAYIFCENILINFSRNVAHWRWDGLSITSWILIVTATLLSLVIAWFSARSLITNLSELWNQVLNITHTGFLRGGWQIFRSFYRIRRTFGYLIIIFVIPLILQFIVEGDYDLFIDEDEVGMADMNRNDTQNVHNTTVTKCVINAVNSLRKLTPHLDTEEVFNSITQHLSNSSHLLAHQALDIVRQIHQKPAYHSGIQLTDMELIALVWYRIHQPINQSNLTDLLNVLTEQLADCQEHGDLLCITGRITRILQTLECLDAEHLVDLRPLWAIRDVIGEYCYHYRDKLIGKCQPVYRKALDADKRTKDQQILVNRISRCLQRNLQSKFQRIYLETHILSQTQLDYITHEYYPHLTD